MRTALRAFLIAASAGADVFRILDDPRGAAQARVDIIQQATRAKSFRARAARLLLPIIEGQL